MFIDTVSHALCVHIQCYFPSSSHPSHPSHSSHTHKLIMPAFQCEKSQMWWELGWLCAESDFTLTLIPPNEEGCKQADGVYKWGCPNSEHSALWALSSVGTQPCESSALCSLSPVGHQLYEHAVLLALSSVSHRLLIRLWDGILGQLDVDAPF